MTRIIPESDWKIFRQLHSVALDRYCQRLLHDVEQITADSGRPAHQRYLDLDNLLDRRQREMCQAFDDLRRSTALIQLAIIYSLGMITEEEIARFTPETRDTISFLATRG